MTDNPPPVRLRYAYNTNGCANHRLEDAVAFIADSGYNGVALTLDIHHLDPFAEGWERAADRLGGELARRGLGLVVETGARFLLDPRQKHEPTLLSPSPEGRARRIDFLSRAMTVCRICGGEIVSFWAGVPRPGVAPEDAMAWLQDGLGRLALEADRQEVEIALEPEPGMLVETVDDYAGLAASLGTHAPRLALDTGHCLVTGERDPEVAVREFASRLGTVAIEDMKRGAHLHLPFGTGDMNVPATLCALREVGFRRLVCVELSRESPRAHEAIPEAIAYLRAAEAGLANPTEAAT